MTNTNISFKKSLAKEVLLFFIGVGLLIIVSIFLLVRNFYYNQKVVSNSHKVSSLKEQIDTLPKDNVKELYDKISKYFVITYQVGNKFYTICKEQENNFIDDEYGIKKNAKLLPNNPVGYFYYKQVDPLNILGKDSTLVFNYVSLKQFKEYLKNDKYLFNLFSVFSNTEKSITEKVFGSADELPPPPLPKGVYAINVDALPDLSKQPYGSTFDLGTRSNFIREIKKGLTYDTSVSLKRIQLTNEREKALQVISDSKSNVLSQSVIWNFVLKSGIILAIILYPIRLCFLSIRWALKTLKTK